MIELKCNICGKEFSEIDLCNNFSLCKNIVYGSKHDGDRVDLHICNKCFDALIDMCAINPIVEE